MIMGMANKAGALKRAKKAGCSEMLLGIGLHLYISQNQTNLVCEIKSNADIIPRQAIYAEICPLFIQMNC